MIELIEQKDRLERIRAMLPSKGSALDIGCGDSFRSVYSGTSFNRIVAINTYQPYVDELRREFPRPGWDFYQADVRDYTPDCLFDAVTMIHVAEHLDLYDLARVFNRLVPACRGIFIVESPEQYDDNERSLVASGNPQEAHRSLVTAEFLARWMFHLVFRYQMNPNFSNAVYVYEHK